MRPFTYKNTIEIYSDLKDIPKILMEEKNKRLLTIMYFIFSLPAMVLILTIVPICDTIGIDLVGE